jgi:microcystin-dependent protein
MANQYLGEIRMFGGNFAPAGWALCSGQILSISQFSALFALLGTTYGGDGVSNFALPDLRGRVPICQGQGIGLSEYVIGAKAGEENVILSTTTMPSHNHQFVSTAAATLDTPTNAVLGTPATGVNLFAPTVPSGTLNASANGATGGNQAHPNVMPYLCTSFIISLTGIFPTRN